VAPVTASRELQLRYATYDQPPPDDLRRAISINALAQSLRLPFETVRRRLIKLTLLGACQVTPSGILVPSRVMFAPIHRAHLERNDALTVELWNRMSGDLQLANPGDKTSPIWSDRPLRILSRVALDYVLRLADQLSEQLGDPTAVAVWAAVTEANGVPIRVQAIARRAQLSAETVRRRVHDLADRGTFQISTSGIIPAQAFTNSAGLDRIVARNRGDLIRMFSVFSDLGVIADWERRGLSQAA
jgi:DNA-binding Lrp family transcriptional regulator